MKYDRRPFAPWIIEVLLMGEHEEPIPTSEKQLAAAPLKGFYRTTWRESKACEQFSLTAQDHDDLFLQIQIFSQNDIRTYGWLPHSLEVHAKAQKIKIVPLYRGVLNPAAPKDGYPLRVETHYFPTIPLTLTPLRPI